MAYPKNFTRQEMLFSATAARHGVLNEPATPDIEGNILFVANQLQTLRDALSVKHGKDISIRVHSCYRSPAVNKLVGGSTRSAHMQGLAADIVAIGVPVAELAHFVAENFEYDQVILEFGAWVHWGVAKGRARREMLTAIKRGGKTVYLKGLV